MTRPVTRIIYVSSFAPEVDEAAVGGFEWFPERCAFAALRYYLDDEAHMPRHSVRLVRMEVPLLDGDELTQWLDDDIDEIEVYAPAILQRLHPNHSTRVMV